MGKRKKDKTTVDHYLATQTTFPRRKIRQLVEQGEVLMNGKVVRDLKTELVIGQDQLMVSGAQIDYQFPLLYYRFNKPKNVITTLDDPKDRISLGTFIKKLKKPLFPVGRLDRHTKGLLLLTNDGEFAQMMTHPKFKVPKEYEVVLDKPLEKAHQSRLKTGLFLPDGPVQYSRIKKFSDIEFNVVISEGRNRIIRRTFEMLGYQVIKLKRLSVGPFQLGSLKEGEANVIPVREMNLYKKMIREFKQEASST